MGKRVQPFKWGGHRWSPAKLQSTYKQAFRCLNWNVCDEANDECSPIQNNSLGFSCSHTEDTWSPRCQFRQSAYTTAENVLSYLEVAELKGITQFPNQLFSNLDVSCVVDLYDQRIQGTRTIGNYIFSRDIFSKTKISCIEAGESVLPGTPERNCCTGNIFEGRCTLPIYSDVSLYLNKFISSTAKDAKSDSLTGYLNSHDVVRIACEKNICSTGVIAPGVLYSKLPISGHEDASGIYRFIDGSLSSNDLINDSVVELIKLFDNGLKLNNHYYCAPKGDPAPLGAIYCDLM